MKQQEEQPWWASLLLLFIEAFMSWMKEEGREEERAAVQEKTDALHEKFDQIDNEPSDGRSALERLRARTQD